MKEVRTTVATLGIIAVLATVAISCAQEQEEPAIVTTSDFFLPVGDAVAGREAFVALECYSCHAVPNDAEMPPPDGEVVGPECGNTMAGKSREFIADSIISPSHIIPPPEMDSPMVDLRAEMSVQQLIDLVAFCSSGQ